MFHSGGFDLVDYFVQKCNDRLANELPDRLGDLEDGENIYGARIAEGIKARLEYIEPVHAAWPEVRHWRKEAPFRCLAAVTA